MPAKDAALEILVAGQVQGVGYRYFAKLQADRLGLNGYVTNLSDGRVKVVVGGSPVLLEAFQDALRQGPPRSQVERLEITPLQEPILPQGFVVRFERS